MLGHPLLIPDEGTKLTMGYHLIPALQRRMLSSVLNMLQRGMGPSSKDQTRPVLATNLSALSSACWRDVAAVIRGAVVCAPSLS